MRLACVAAVAALLISATAAAQTPLHAEQSARQRLVESAALGAPRTAGFDAAVLRAQVALDRLGFSPGVIDGLPGANFSGALADYQGSAGLAPSGLLDAATLASLVAAAQAPALDAYQITQADLAGPFIAAVPESLEAQAELESLAYTSVREMLAERFHMDEDLLLALNPGAAFAAGETILAANVGPAVTGAAVRIVVDKAASEVRAHDAAGRLLARYPATIGSAALPSPEGEMQVRAIAPEPNYTFDPKRVSSNAADKPVIVPPGPNNPVGSAWIDLTKDTYGVHGTPAPALIGKTASLGCVRLTNWDVEELAAMTKPGASVVFLGLGES